MQERKGAEWTNEEIKKKRIELGLDKLEKIEKERKRINIVIAGLKKKIIKEKMKVKNTWKIREVGIRLGVELGKSEYKIMVMQNKTKLENEKIFIDNDLTRMEKKIWKNLDIEQGVLYYIFSINFAYLFSHITIFFYDSIAFIL